MAYEAVHDLCQRAHSRGQREKAIAASALGRGRAATAALCALLVLFGLAGWRDHFGPEVHSITTLAPVEESVWLPTLFVRLGVLMVQDLIGIVHY